MALVIGIGAYENVAKLDNPEYDMRAVSRALMEHGFDVTAHLNLSQSEMYAALRLFREKADTAKTALIYFAGHGIEISGENYLIPVDARLSDERDVAVEAIPLSALLSQISGANALKIIVLDACRDNPFSTQMKVAGRGRSVGRGLALVETNEPDTLIAYAAAAGATTPDGKAGVGSPFSLAFVEALGGPAVDVRRFFGSVRDIMRQRVPGAEPFVYTSLGGSEHIIQGKDGRLDTPVVTTPSFNEPSLAMELAFWESVKGSKKAEDFEDYLERFPNGTFSGVALRRLAAIGKTPTSTVNQTVQGSEAKIRYQGFASEVLIPANLLFKSSRESKIELQKWLSTNGYYAGAIDGVLGRISRRALEAYFRNLGPRVKSVVQDVVRFGFEADSCGFKTRNYKLLDKSTPFKNRLAYSIENIRFDSGASCFPVGTFSSGPQSLFRLPFPDGQGDVVFTGFFDDGGYILTLSHQTSKELIHYQWESNKPRSERWYQLGPQFR